MKVIPPNFGYVEEGIFRCGAPEPRHYGFLASLGLRTCILLTDTHDGAFVHWLQETGVMIFCPLSNEAQTRGSFRGGSHTYSTMGGPGNMSFPQLHNSKTGREGVTSTGTAQPPTASGGGNGNTISNGSSHDDGREVTASPSSGFVEGFKSSNGPYANKEDDGADGGEGNFDVSGDYNGDVALNNSNNNTVSSNSVGAGGVRVNRDGWGNQANNSGATTGTSNAVRFLQENVVERQVSTKFSPVLVQEPIRFPGSIRHGGGGGSGSAVDGSYQFVTAPSYEGKLHGLMTLSEAVVVSILHILLDPRYYPLLITCSKGRYRSGIVCGCLRKLQGWNLVSILEEYRRFAGNKSRADNEEFIELFDEDLVNLELSGGRRPTILYNT